MEPETKKINIKPIVGIILLVILIPAIILSVTVGLPLYKTYQDSQKVYAKAKIIKEVVKEQDIQKISESILAIKKELEIVKSDLGKIAWAQVIPVFGPYLSDAIHGVNAAGYGLEAAEIISNAVEPYSDLLGLKGKGTFTGGTIEDRIAKTVETLDKVTPQLDQVSAKINLAKKEFSQINPRRYPETFRGVKIREQLTTASLLIDQVSNFLTEAKPLAAKLPYLLGANGERKYLVLFQNDAEIRPTGGFLTAYAVFRIEKGRINIDTSDDIYKLDATVTKRVAPPEPIKLYLREYDWKLRNTNFSPDFEVSMKNFLSIYNSSPERKKIDGIFALDTYVLVKIMDILGPITAYGINFTTEKVPQCDCPMVIWELEKYADEPKAYERESRKDIIGVLLQAMLQKAMKVPKNLWGPLFQTGLSQIEEKHVLVYLLDPEAQKGLQSLGASGQIKTYDGDYLHINDANLGGAKSNLYITQSVKQEISIKPDGTETNLTIEYRHPRRADNCSLERKEGLCLSGIYRDYVRVYLPLGSQIIEARGFESKNNVFEDLGKTVVDGFFTVVPEGLARLQIKYKTPVKFAGVYREFIQKQPGTNANKYTIIVNGKSQTFNLLKDQEIKINL
ncbi:MAG: DUF4012 domain-containing protein [Patescibacteria group bacterium]|mgnify:FL=1